MSKRLLLAVLILGASLGILAVIVFVLRPFEKRTSEQPSPLPESRPFQPSDAVPKPSSTSTAPAPRATDPAERERQEGESLKRDAMDLTARFGSYSSADSFASLSEFSGSVSARLEAEFKAKQKELTRQYPDYGPSWGRTFRPLVASIVSGTPLLTSSRAVIEVQGQLITEAEGENPVVTTAKMTLTFEKIGNSWVLSGMKEEKLEL